MSDKVIPTQLLGTCVIVLSEGKIMLGKRKNCHGAGLYGLPGGRIGLAEKVLDCTKRELKEETGLVVNNLEYVGVIRDIQDGYSFTHFAFLCKEIKTQPELKEPEKCECWEWFEKDNLPDNILPGHKAAIDIYLDPGSETLRDVSSI